MIEKLNKHEFFKAKNVISRELQKGIIPEITYYRDNDSSPYTIYIVIKNEHKDGGDFHNYVAHAKRESLVKQKVEDLQRIVEMYKERYLQEAL